MKKNLLLFLFLPSILLSNTIYQIASPQIIRTQYIVSGRSFSSTIWNTGVFNQFLAENLSPAFQWPENSGKFLSLSAGMCVGAYIDGGLRIANATYNGEFVPGWMINGGGIPIPKTSESFHLYKVSSGDNCSNNQDYCDWGSMVNRGAPFVDVNQNTTYDPGIDIPGIKNASQTIFVCLIDGFPESHNISEGFSGGTSPLCIELGFTSWIYNYEGYEDVQFFKYFFTNRSLKEWKKTYFSLFYHPQIGDSLDDYVGCDTLRRLGYAYNKDNSDGTGIGNSYGEAPPAVGVKLLNDNLDIGMTSFHYTIPLQAEPCPPCEEFPNNPLEAYNLMRGYKKDNTPWVDATSPTPKTTKYTFTGDPETGAGWNEYNGTIGNCFGALSGELTPNQSVTRSFLMSSGSDNLNISPLFNPQFVYAQFMARGSNNKNSVTELKLLSDKVQQFYNNGYVISINPISTTIPNNFTLFQNYPNPFNPETKIKFEIPQSDFVNLSVYDLNGRLIEELVNEKLSGGTYEVNFSPKNLSSGIYFYHLKTTKFTETKRMILLK